MRLFEDMGEAASEIRRDLVKSPMLISTRVQGVTKEQWAHEAMGYSYAIMGGGIPGTIPQLVEWAVPRFEFWKENADQLMLWMGLQCAERLEPLAGYRGVSDDMHPELTDMREGGHYAYTYRERMIGMIPTIVQVLKRNPDSRRAYWPIFQPIDAIRAPEMTRIPCTLGYHFAIRNVPGSGPHLHLTYLQRSLDFEKFWCSDVWLAHQAQLEVARLLDVDPGNFSHMILSLHFFTQEEIF